MRSKTSTWYECKIKYDKMQEDGTQKSVTEQYVLDALSFTETESRITEEMSSFISGDFKITDIKPAKYTEIFFDDVNKGDKWYKAKLNFITLDEKTGKEKKTSVLYLVQGGSLNEASKNIGQVMDGTVNEYVSTKIEETKILDVYEHSV